MIYILILFTFIIFIIFIRTSVNKYNPAYDPNKYNKNTFIKKSHNCYMYALDDIDLLLADKCKKNNLNCNDLKHRPGHTKYYISTQDVSTCKNIKKGIIDDNTDIYITNLNSKCKNGFYKIASSVNNNKTFHFYRQDDDYLWSHKDGSSNATNLDKNNQLIKDPQKANRGIYKTFCNYFCVPNNKLKDTYSNKTLKKN
uniref:Uncharacterized protein n=1 Tax=viral metagenome TaxID=1070528 RepID=A0A6C0J8I7_9ZZZZ